MADYPRNRTQYSDEYVTFSYDPYCNECHGTGWRTISDGDCGTETVVCECHSDLKSNPNPPHREWY